MVVMVAVGVVKRVVLKRALFALIFTVAIFVVFLLLVPHTQKKGLPPYEYCVHAGLALATTASTPTRKSLPA